MTDHNGDPRDHTQRMATPMEREFDRTRRFFAQTAVTAGLITLGGLWTPAAARDETENSVTPPEDLMREHGVLDRVLLIYEAAIARFAADEDFDPALISQSAKVIRDFIEDYHEKSEEEQVFYRFTKANRMVDLVAVLLRQHSVGRKVTDTILRLAPTSRQDGDDRRKLVAAMQSFIRMYRPHAAREDTDLFPRLRSLVSSNEYDAIAEQFERDERALFGEDGFGKMVDHVAGIERMIGIDDLAKVTPT
jgi:hemerythrin-like domain-containing protein